MLIKTDSEFNQYIENKKPLLGFNKTKHVPDSLDYRKLGWLTKIKSQQGYCSSIVFSVVSALESQFFKMTGNLVSMSEQYLIDCLKFINSCSPTLGKAVQLINLLKYHNGIPSDFDYPYAARKNQCKFREKANKLRVVEHKKVNPKNESHILETLSVKGPLIAFLSFPKGFRTYQGGEILNGSLCNGLHVNHAVNLIGYDKFSYIFRNSWGKDWGDSGYFKVERKSCQFSEPLVYMRIQVEDIFKSKHLLS